MASPKVADALKQVSSESDKGPGYEALLSNIKSISHPDTIEADLNAVADAFFPDSLSIVTTRAILATFINTLKDLNNDDLTVAVGRHVIDLISSTPQSSAAFVGETATLLDLIATAHEHNEDFQAAATTLAEISLESSQRRVSDKERVTVWIRIMRNYLEVDDSVSAERYLNRLKNVMHQISDPELRLHFRLSTARIEDSKWEFLKAAATYHEISLSPSIAEEERLHTLAMAIKCAILAPAGPLRSRALGRLHKDDRSARLEEFGIMEKMFLDRLIAPAEVERFAQGLVQHQLAITSDGSTILARAVVEHNLLAASRIYNNVDFDSLAGLLGLDAKKVEKTTARMIEQGRLVGRIDQLDRIVWFEHGQTASGRSGSGRAEVIIGKEIRRWDEDTRAVMEQVESITDMLQREMPEFVAGFLTT